MNSRPLSDRILEGGPRAMKRSAKSASTSSCLSCRATIKARHSRLASSMTVRMRNLRPSWVRPSTKSYAQTCPGYSGRNRMHEPSFSHNRSEEHTSELQPLMRISYAVFCLKKKKKTHHKHTHKITQTYQQNRYFKSQQHHKN